MFRFIIPTVFSCVLIIPLFVAAERVVTLETPAEAIPAYRQISEPLTITTPVPAVHEYMLPSDLVKTRTAVYNQTIDEFVYHRVFTEIVPLLQPIVTTDLTGPAPALYDADSETSVNFSLPADGEGTVAISYLNPVPLTATQFNYRLAQNVAKPKTVAIYATDDLGRETIVVAPTEQFGSGVIRFPETTATNWRVVFTYIQPLRLEEATFTAIEPAVRTEQRVRFLGTSGQHYQILLDPDRTVMIDGRESINLTDEDNLEIVPGVVTLRSNPRYQPADSDSDGVIDVLDNCVSTANQEQLDLNNNGRGDACDDFDGDGHSNSDDNCPDVPNRNQSDEDGDGAGDRCDEEDSRLTEQYAWLPWVGIGTAASVLLVLFAIVGRRSKASEETNEVQEVTQEQ